MSLSDDEIFFPGNDFHLKVSIDRVDDVEFVNNGGDSLVAGFGEDDGADVVFVGETRGAEVHVDDVAYCCEAAGDVFYFRGQGCCEDVL